MSSRVQSICSSYFMGTFLWACWTLGREGLVLMVYMPGMLPIVSHEPGKSHFRATMLQATTVSGMGASARLGVGGLRADLGCLALRREGEQGSVGLRADLGQVPLGREGLCGSECTDGDPELDFVVFLMPVRGNCHGERVCSVAGRQGDPGRWCVFGSLPQATMARGPGEGDGVYMQLSHFIWNLKLKDP